MRSRSIVYWIMTSLIAFFIGVGGLSQIWQYRMNPHGTVPELLYPMYFFCILGVWKALGAIAILVPRFSAAQGVGLRRHLLRLDRRGRIGSCGGRLRSLRLSCDRAAGAYGIHAGIVGAEAGEPQDRQLSMAEGRLKRLDIMWCRAEERASCKSESEFHVVIGAPELQILRLTTPKLERTFGAPFAQDDSEFGKRALNHRTPICVGRKIRITGR